MSLLFVVLLFPVELILAAAVLSPTRIVILKEGKLLKVTKNMCNSLCNIQTGSKSEMEQLEDDFVAGKWIPSFLNQEPKKGKKRKHIDKNNTQKTKKAKENQPQK